MYGPKTSSNSGCSPDPVSKDYSDSDSIDPCLGNSGPVVKTPNNPAPKRTHPGFPFPGLGKSGWGFRIPYLSGRFDLKNIIGRYINNVPIFG